MTVTGTPVTSASVTGSYCDQNDVENVFGANNIISWSNLDNEMATANTVRIQKAIDVAEEHIDNRFRNSRYAVPFSGTIPEVITDMAAKLAGVWLYQSRGIDESDEEEKGKISRIKDSVDKDIGLYLSGARHLNAALSDTFPTGPVVVEN